MKSRMDYDGSNLQTKFNEMHSVQKEEKAPGDEGTHFFFELFERFSFFLFD
jgi:hypothetical protein